MQNLNPCDCCESISVETPVQVSNRPGLKAISYRIGTHSQFKESLLAKLSLSQKAALRRLTTRSNDDFTIALLDAWAMVSDVLTFYQERIANESYLSTATDQLSIVELARLIGYELRPGVAASTYLAFTIDDATLLTGQALISGISTGEEEAPTIQIEVGTKIQSIPGQDEKPQTYETVEDIEAKAEWNAMRPRLSQPQTELSKQTTIFIKGTSNNLKKNDVILIVENEKPVLKKVQHIDEESNTTQICFEVTASTEQQRKEEPEWKDGIFVFRKRAAVFGYNAPKQVKYTGTLPDIASTWEDWPFTGNQEKVYLDNAYEEILSESHIAIQHSSQSAIEAIPYIVNAATIRSHTAYGISGKSTEIKILPNQQWWEPKADLAAIRSLTVHAQSEALELVEAPITTIVEGNTLMLSQLYLGLVPEKTVLVSGERADLLGTHANEIKVLKEVYIVNGYTILEFKENLEHKYIRKTVTVNANVALATHGETVSEILGSGDASQAFQKFVLKQPPLTFISAATPSGTASTLEIRVNDILWKEVPSLYAKTSNEHIYITRQNSEAQTTVTFGDGITGARLPSGQQNIKATYRKGIGAEGLLKAYQLSQLVSRPLGVKAVMNPLATVGAQNRELLADARSNANLTIYTLDRVVSLQDYEDFARAFAGVTKALATWTRCGKRRCVHLTVAGADGAAIEPNSTLSNNLLDAIREVGIPDVRVNIATYQSRFFRVEGKIQVHPDYLSEKVLAEVEQALRTHFSFEQRQFGQAVTLSEVISIMQNVAGVVAVDIDNLYKIGTKKERNHHLPAAIAIAGQDNPLAAELLTIDPTPLALTTFGSN